MKLETFNGDFYEIGLQQGKLYKANGMSFDKVKIDHDLYKQQLDIYKKHYPDMLEEFRGMAEGGNFDKDQLIYNFITGQIFYYKDKLRIDKACTIFGRKTNGKLFVGRNYDWLPETENLFEAYKVINEKKYSFIGISDMGIISKATAKPKYLFYDPDDAINDQGLFIGLTFASADYWAYGLSSSHIIKLIAETCSSVEEAIEVFETVPICCPKNFFIADKEGGMVVIEHTSRRFKVCRPQNNILIQTNHYIDGELKKEDTVLKRYPDTNTFKRYSEAMRNIKAARSDLTINSTAEILSTPGNDTCQNFPGMKTIWTLALEMTSRKYQIFWNVHKNKKSQELVI